MQGTNIEELKGIAFSRVKAELPELFSIRDRMYHEPEVGHGCGHCN